MTGAFLETKELKREQRLWMSGPKNFQLPDHDPAQLFEVVRPLYGFNDSHKSGSVLSMKQFELWDGSLQG